MFQIKLYSIQFLHQITTWDRATSARRPLYSIQFLHQITTNVEKQCRLMGCIVSNFYIKSQRTRIPVLISSSCIVSNFYIKSQHFTCLQENPLGCIVSNFYIKSQPRADRRHFCRRLYSIQFLHQITTDVLRFAYRSRCIVSNFYIKSQLKTRIMIRPKCCIVSNFYIKSQRDRFRPKFVFRCIVSNFYIKSQPYWDANVPNKVV